MVIYKFFSTKGAARTVGYYAMNHAHKAAFYVPTHRVVNRNGLLTGKTSFETPTMMQELLEMRVFVFTTTKYKILKR